LPAPNVNIQNIDQPEVGLIVKFNGTNWVDELGRNWNNAVKFNLPDKDVFAISANANPPAETTFFTGVGTILFNMATNPITGAVYVSNTDANNAVRFEGPGDAFGSTTVQGHLHEARITVLNGSTVTPRHLNKHIDYAIVPSVTGVKDVSLATPTGMAVTSNGQTLYVAAFGSSKVGVYNTAQLETNTFTPSAVPHVAVSGGGASGLVLDESRNQLYVFTRFDNAVSVVSTTSNLEVAHVPVYNPEPPKWSLADRCCTTPAKPPATARRRAPRVTSSATSTVWHGISAIPTTPCSTIPIRFASVPWAIPTFIR
jgi:DNA-binding beta-propeller fold protein YncE